jgi:hypothetical protein
MEYDEEAEQLQLDVLRAEIDLLKLQALEVKFRNHITLNKLGVDKKLYLVNGYILQSNQNQSPEKLKKEMRFKWIDSYY